MTSELKSVRDHLQTLEYETSDLMNMMAAMRRVSWELNEGVDTKDPPWLREVRDGINGLNTAIKHQMNRINAAYEAAWRALPK